MRIIVVGCGKTAGEIVKNSHTHEIVAVVRQQHEQFQSYPTFFSIEDTPLDHADVIIDFSSANDILKRITAYLHAKKPFVIGTTGWHTIEPEAKKLVLTHQGACVISPNFSIGVAIFKEIVRYASSLLCHFPNYDIAVQETHHKMKSDHPSGTALLLARTVQDIHPKYTTITTNLAPGKREENQLHISSMRVGHNPGEHSVFFGSKTDTITLTHSSHSRDAFAEGALFAAEWVTGKNGWFTMDDIIEDIIDKKPL